MFAFKDYKRAIFKFNGGRGALLCNCCRIIVATGNGPHEDREHYCDECKKRLSGNGCNSSDQKQV
jgi:hypothetical protein